MDNQKKNYVILDYQEDYDLEFMLQIPCFHFQYIYRRYQAFSNL